MTSPRSRRPDRGALRDLIGLDAPPEDGPTLWRGRAMRGDGFVREEVSFNSRDGDEVSGHLVLPNAVERHGGAVLVHHQHASLWHLGSSEVAGLDGDPWQAFGPALARAGIVVLVCDVVGFATRRRSGSGIAPHPDDGANWGLELTSRLVVGDSLGRKVLADAEDAFGALRMLKECDPDRIGVLGHSMGGNIAMLQAALDERVAFAALSGCAGTLRGRLAAGTGIELTQVIPGLALLTDVDDLLAMIAPRTLLVVAGDDDRYAADVKDVAATTAARYAERDAGAAFRSVVRPGGHDLDAGRFQVIVDWVTSTAAA